MSAITPTAIAALKLLKGSSRFNTCSAKSLAGRLWPEKLADCHTSLRRGGLYRAAGAHYSKLAKKGWVGHWMDDFSSGYFLTQAGVDVLASTEQGQGSPATNTTGPQPATSTKD